MARNPNRYSISPRSGRLRKRIPARDHRSLFVRVRDNHRLLRFLSFLVVLTLMVLALYKALHYFGSPDVMLRKSNKFNGVRR